VPEGDSKHQAQSRVAEMRLLCRKCKQSEKENFLANPRWTNELDDLIAMMIQEARCVDIYTPTRAGKYTCMGDIHLTDKLKAQVVTAPSFRSFGL